MICLTRKYPKIKLLIFSTGDHQILFLVCVRVNISVSHYEAESAAEI